MRPLIALALHVALLVLIVGAFEVTDWDLAVQEGFFERSTGTWALEKEGGVLRALFYDGARRGIIAFGCVCVAAWIASYRWKPLTSARRAFALLALALICIPATTGLLKHTTNVHFPSRLARYGGKKPYVKLLQPVPGWYEGRSGKGWPAGHASAGFALMMLGWVLPTPHTRRLGLALGLAAGWSMGLVQTASGAHFLSHTLATQSIACIEIVGLVALYDRATSPGAPALDSPRPAARPARSTPPSEPRLP